MRTAFAVMALTIVAPAHAAVFGITPGQSLDGLRAIPLAPTTMQTLFPHPAHAHLFRITPPEPNGYFVDYVVVATDEAGICAIYARSTPQPDEYLATAQDEHREIMGVLANRYGEGKSWFGFPVSRGDAPKAFGVGATVQGAYWWTEVGDIEPGLAHLTTVVNQKPTSVGVVYEFDNFPECAKVSEVVIDGVGL